MFKETVLRSIVWLSLFCLLVCPHLVLLDCKVISIFYIFKNERKSENDEKWGRKTTEIKKGKVMKGRKKKILIDRNVGIKRL